MVDGFRYAREKFGVARRMLMVPHPKGENEDLVYAFHEITLGLRDFEGKRHPSDRAMEQVATLRKYVSPEVTVPWDQTIAGMSDDQKHEFSAALDGVLFHLEDDRSKG